jgi:hypothetical protein
MSDFQHFTDPGPLDKPQPTSTERRQRAEAYYQEALEKQFAFWKTVKQMEADGQQDAVRAIREYVAALTYSHREAMFGLGAAQNEFVSAVAQAQRIAIKAGLFDAAGETPITIPNHPAA